MSAYRSIIWFLWGFALSTIVALVFQAAPAAAQSRVPALRGTVQPGMQQPGLRVPAERDEGDPDTVDPETGNLMVEPGEETGDPDADAAAQAARRMAAGDFRPTVRDGDAGYPAGPVQPIDGDVEVGEPAPPPDGYDPTKIDTRPLEEYAPFENPPAGHDPLLFQIEDINPLLDRRPERLYRFEPFDPVGIPIGSFVLFPELEVGGIANRNILKSPVASSDVAIDTRPFVRLVSNWKVHALEFRAGGDFNGHNHFASENDRAYHLEARGRYDVSRFTNIQGEISHDVTQESRQVLEASRTGPRSDVTVDRAAASLNHRFNRLSLQLRGSVSDISYEPPVSSVAAVSDRDYQNATETLRATWEFKPTLLAFAEFGLDQRNYDVAAASDGIERTSAGERYRFGLSFGSTGAVLRGEASLGYGRQAAKDDRLKPVDGVLIDANLAWRVTALSSLLFNARTDLGESNIAGTAGAITHFGSVDARHAFFQYLIGTAGLSYAVTDYSGIAITERDLRATATIEYYLNRETVLFTRYQHTVFDTTSPNASYTDDEIRFGVRLRR